jgi:hypothetical protein
MILGKHVVALAAALALASPGQARAQQAMEFEPVPPESVTAAERRSPSQIRSAIRQAVRKAPVDQPPAIPAPPALPGASGVPESRRGDVVRIGSDIHIQEGQVVDGDVFALQGDIRVDGHVKGNVAATGGDVVLGPTARVDGDVMCIGGRLEEEPGARVGGQRVTALRGPRERPAHRVHPEEWPHRRGAGLSFAFSWFLVSLLLAWGIPRFAPVRTGVALATLKREPGLSLLLGLLVVMLVVPSLVAMALLVVILCITIIGIPLALGVMLAYALLLVVLALWGYVVGAIPVGERLSARTGGASDPARAALLGVLGISGLRLVAELFRFLPLFGWLGHLLWVIAALAGAVVTLMGAGALVRSKFGLGVGARWWPLFKPAPSPAPAPASAPGPGEGGSTPAAGGTTGEPSPSGV